MPHVVVGNTAPVEAVKPDPSTDEVERIDRSDLGWTETVWIIPNDESLANAIQAVTTGFRTHHSNDDPAWVESDDPVLEAALQREFGVEGRPSDWETQKAKNSPTPEDPGVSPTAVEPTGKIEKSAKPRRKDAQPDQPEPSDD